MNRESLVVLEGSSGRNLAFGPTHDAASVLPGERGNSVIAGSSRHALSTCLRTCAWAIGCGCERPDGSARCISP